MKIKRTYKNNIWTVTLEHQGTIYRADNKSHDMAIKKAFKLVNIEGIK